MSVAPINRAVLTGAYPKTDDGVALVFQALGAPSWTGCNLDALFDFLTGEAAGPIEICWIDPQGPTRLIATLKDAAEERKDLTLLFQPAARPSS